MLDEKISKCHDKVFEIMTGCQAKEAKTTYL